MTEPDMSKRAERRASRSGSLIAPTLWRCAAVSVSVFVGATLLARGSSSGASSRNAPSTSTPGPAVAPSPPSSPSSSSSPSSRTNPPRTPITSAQASVLSRALLRNFEAGGADVTITVPFGIATFALSGAVDWKGHAGRTTMRTSFRDGTAPKSSSLFWSRTVLVSTLDGLGEAMMAKGRTGVRYVVRPLDPEKVAVDRVLTFLDRLSSDRAENPLLIRQRGVAWLGRKRIGGRDADGFDLNDQTYLWIDAASGRIVRVEARLADASDLVVFDLRRHGPRTVTFPPPAEVVRTSDIPEIYEQLSRRGR